MQRFTIVGGKRLAGSVRINGAKNAVLPILAATLLTAEECVIRDVPRLNDVACMVAILRKLGVKIENENLGGMKVYRLKAESLAEPSLPERLTRSMRSSIVLMGSLLGRTGEARISYPGGCDIGPRPINFHLKALRALGVDFKDQGGYIEARTDGLKGAVIYLDQPSVGATENAMLAAVLARGSTTILNAAREPEIADLAGFLNAMGARVSGAGTDTIRIEGVSRLHGADYRVIPDRIEAGTYMLAGAITGGDVTLENVIPEHLEIPIAKLREAGAEVALLKDASAEGREWRIRVRGPQRPRPLDIKTMPYPGFPTDLQSQFMSLLCLAEGTSTITETIFENRFKVVNELRRMGARILVDGRVAVIRGVPRLSGSVVEAMDDLRGGAALVLAGLAADGNTEVEGIHHIERGYEDMDGKLRALGAEISRTGTPVLSSGQYCYHST